MAAQVDPITRIDQLARWPGRALQPTKISRYVSASASGNLFLRSLRRRLHINADLRAKLGGDSLVFEVDITGDQISDGFKAKKLCVVDFTSFFHEVPQSEPRQQANYLPARVNPGL